MSGPQLPDELYMSHPATGTIVIVRGPDGFWRMRPDQLRPRLMSRSEFEALGFAVIDFFAS
jgi:hypothetical protein